MAINFRLAYNQGIEYVDLFPRTNMEAILNADSAMRYNIIDVTIPAISGNPVTQAITIDTTNIQIDAPASMFLTSVGEQEENDYATIDQFEVTDSTLTITRLYNWPVGDIDVKLIFKEKGV